MTTATMTWRQLLRDVLTEGTHVAQDSPGAEWRGRTSYELIATTTAWDMSHAVVACPERKLGYRFLAAEAAWVLSGSNRLEELAPYASALRKMSDDGEFLAGAYGPPWVEQLPFLYDVLTRDPLSRQAVATIWRPRPRSSADTPCTIALQFLIRPSGLHCVATMRSSDAFYGVPYDVHTFSMLAAYLALLLRPKLGPLALGTLHLTAGSQHLYVLDHEPARKCAWVSTGVGLDPVREDELFDLAPLDLADFAKPAELIEHLWSRARREGVTYGSYLAETIR